MSIESEVDAEITEAVVEGFKKSLVRRAKGIKDWSQWGHDMSVKCIPFGKDRGGDYGEPRSVAVFPDGCIKAIDMYEGDYYGDWYEVSSRRYLEYLEAAERAIDKVLEKGYIVGREEL